MNIFDMLEKWRSAPYDGLRGMPPDWTIENVVIDLMARQYVVAGAILDDEITLSEAIRHLRIHIKKEQLLREEDRLQEAHEDQEAFRVGAILERLKLPKTSKVNDSIAWLARLYEDLKLGKDECHRLWLGNIHAANIRIGQVQRERGQKAGRKGGEQRRLRSEGRKIVRSAKLLLQEGEGRRGLAAKIKDAGNFSVSVRWINEIIRNAKIK